jgi:hypothetical protein
MNKQDKLTSEQRLELKQLLQRPVARKAPRLPAAERTAARLAVAQDRLRWEGSRLVTMASAGTLSAP